MGLRKKYKKDRKEYVDELKKLNQTLVLDISNIGRSKIKGNFIYKVDFLEGGKVREIEIVAADITQALAKLEPYANMGVPAEVLKIMLGDSRLNS